MTTELGNPSDMVWAPVWSPDGARLAFFSDRGGQAGVWIWQPETARAWRFPDVIIRPYDAGEAALWSSDSTRLLLAILPRGMSLEAAAVQDGASFIRTKEVSVLGANLGTPDESSVAATVPERIRHSHVCDLGVLDLRSRTVLRIAERVAPLWYGFSPDSHFVAWVSAAAADDARASAHSELTLYDVKYHTARTLHLPESVRGWSWSPDSREIAYYETRVQPHQGASTELRLLSVPDGQLSGLGNAGLALIRSDKPPLWDETSRHVFVLGTAATPADSVRGPSRMPTRIWRVDVHSGQVSPTADFPGEEVVSAVENRIRGVIWSADRGQSIWVLTRHSDQSWPEGTALHQVYAATGRSGRTFAVNTGWSTRIIGANKGKEIFLIRTDQQHPPDVWALDSSSGRQRQITWLEVNSVQSCARSNGTAVIEQPADLGGIEITLVCEQERG